MIYYILVGFGSALVGFIGGFLFGTIRGAKFAHQVLQRQGRLKEIMAPTKANQDFQ
jgi:hypothetical protein